MELAPQYAPAHLPAANPTHLPFSTPILRTGTHVAATAVGLQVGVAKDAEVVAVRILDCTGSGTISDTVAGLGEEVVVREGQMAVRGGQEGATSLQQASVVLSCTRNAQRACLPHGWQETVGLQPHATHRWHDHAHPLCRLGGGQSQEARCGHAEPGHPGGRSTRTPSRSMLPSPV